MISCHLCINSSPAKYGNFWTGTKRKLDFLCLSLSLVVSMTMSREPQVKRRDRDAPDVVREKDKEWAWIWRGGRGEEGERRAERKCSIQIW